MGLRYRLLLLIFLAGFTANAQQIGFGLTNFVGSGLSNDLGLNLSFVKPLPKHALQFELEMRSIDWGNSLNFGLGFKATYKEFSALTIGGITSGYFGVSPFQQKSFATYGIAYLPYLKLQSKGRLYIEMAFGIRYNVVSGYNEYGNYSQLEFPLRITSGWQLSHQE